MNSLTGPCLQGADRIHIPSRKDGAPSAQASAQMGTNIGPLTYVTATSIACFTPLWCWGRLESPLDCKEIETVNSKGN